MAQERAMRVPPAALSLAACLLFLAGVASAQEPPDSVVVRGTVIDATSREALPLAYVVHEGTSTRMITEEDGVFSLTLPPADDYEIRVGRYGYLDMRFQVDDQVRAEGVIIPLEPQPIRLAGVEITVDRIARLEERLETRSRQYPGPVRSLGPEQIAASGVGTALDLIRRRSSGLFECWDTPGELCARRRASASVRNPFPSRERVVLVCVDERRAWGGTAELESISSDEVYRLEFYGLGGRSQIRLYTRWFVARNLGRTSMGLSPVEWTC